MMKKLLMASILAVLAISELALAGGTHYEGTVSVWTSGTRTYMSGMMSIRYSEFASGSPYIYAYGSPASSGSGISFAGRNSSGTNFSCWVSPDHPHYQDAIEIKNNLQNGSYLYVYKKTKSNDCEGFSLGNYSYNLE